jgi:hypothetical protein
MAKRGSPNCAKPIVSGSGFMIIQNIEHKYLTKYAKIYSVQVLKLMMLKNQIFYNRLLGDNSLKSLSIKNKQSKVFPH